MIVLGGISYAKSTLIKTYIYRQYLFGRQAWVIEPHRRLCRIGDLP